MPQALQCPRCHGSVSVPDDAAGQRVKCPHCEQSFLAPGVAQTTKDDDDWLVLDSDPVRTSDVAEPIDLALPDVPPAPIPSVETGGETSGNLSSPAADPFLETESAPPSASGNQASSNSDDLFSDLPPMDVAPPMPPTSAPPNPMSGPPMSGLPVSGPNADPVEADPFDLAPPVSIPVAKTTAAIPTEYETEYRVKCNICGSILYAKAAQAGKTLKCSDCHSQVPIPPPPKKKKKADIDIANAETFSLEQSEVSERKDPFQKSADELLAEASRVEEEDTEPKYDDIPSVKRWAKNVFGVFLDPGVLAHWLALSMMASIPAFLALSIESPILVLGLFPAGFFLGALVVSCGFAIVQAVANEEESVSEWPVFDPIGWLSQLFVALAAALVAAGPALIVTQLGFGASLISVAITMLSIYVLFPFVLLSMLDMQSPFVPFSAEVARSFTKCEEAWGGFYFSSGVLFVGLFLIFAMASTMSAGVAAVLSIFAGIAIAFTYFAMIGRLAFAIGQSVNAPPMKSDIDRNQQGRSRDGSM